MFILELISIMPQRRPEVATAKTRRLAASLNGELGFLFSVQKLLFVQDFRSISLQETHVSVFSWMFKTTKLQKNKVNLFKGP